MAVAILVFRGTIPDNLMLPPYWWGSWELWECETFRYQQEQVELLEDQMIKWRYRLPELTDDESKARIVSAVEVREELDEFKEVVLRKLKEFLTNLNTLQESVRLIENDREESWEAISHKVSTLVEDSVGSLTERLTELEYTVQSRRTTPVSDDDVRNMETWSTMEQAIWSDLGKVRKQVQEVPESIHLVRAPS